MLTSRVAVADIQRFKEGAAPVLEVDRLSEEAGVELLRDNDVWGTEARLRLASRDFGGHPLALPCSRAISRKPRTATSAAAITSAACSPTPTIRATIRRGG